MRCTLESHTAVRLVWYLSGCPQIGHRVATGSLLKRTRRTASQNRFSSRGQSNGDGEQILQSSHLPAPFASSPIALALQYARDLLSGASYADAGRVDNEPSRVACKHMPSPVTTKERSNALRIPSRKLRVSAPSNVPIA